MWLYILMVIGGGLVLLSALSILPAVILSGKIDREDEDGR